MAASCCQCLVLPGYPVALRGTLADSLSGCRCPRCALAVRRAHDSVHRQRRAASVLSSAAPALLRRSLGVFLSQAAHSGCCPAGWQRGAAHPRRCPRRRDRALLRTLGHARRGAAEPERRRGGPGGVHHHAPYDSMVPRHLRWTCGHHRWRGVLLPKAQAGRAPRDDDRDGCAAHRERDEGQRQVDGHHLVHVRHHSGLGLHVSGECCTHRTPPRVQKSAWWLQRNALTAHPGGGSNECLVAAEERATPRPSPPRRPSRPWSRMPHSSVITSYQHEAVPHRTTPIEFKEQLPHVTPHICFAPPAHARSLHAPTRTSTDTRATAALPSPSCSPPRASPPAEATTSSLLTRAPSP